MFLVVLLSAMMALFCWAVMISVWRRHQLQRQAQDWPTARGRIFGSSVDTDEWTDVLAVVGSFVRPFSSGGPKYQPCVCYRYSVAGYTYESQRLDFTSKKFWQREEAEDVIKPYPAGAEVTVHYMPQEPSIAVLSIRETVRLELCLALVVTILTTALLVTLPFGGR